MEALEARRVLAAYPIGDANLDYVVDEADLIQVFKADTYEKDAPATWTTGDWNTVVTDEGEQIGDGRFDMDDIIAVITGGRYRAEDAPVSESSQVSEGLLDDSVETEIELVHDKANNEIAIRSSVPITSLRVTSDSGSLSTDAPEASGFFDVFEANTQFHLDPAGYNFRSLGEYAVGADVEPVDDLRVSGSRSNGGGLQGVAYVACDGCLSTTKAGMPADENALQSTEETATVVTSPALPFLSSTDPVTAAAHASFDESLTIEDFVAAFTAGNHDLMNAHSEVEEPSEQDADATVYYDPTDGTIRIEGSETLLTSIHLHSKSGRLRTDGLWSSIYVVSTRQSVVAHVPRGMHAWRFPQLLQPGLDLQAILDDLTVQGATTDGEVIVNFNIACENCTWDRSAGKWTVEGDFTFDQQLAVDDVDLLYEQIVNEDDRTLFDLNRDGEVNRLDLDYMIHDLLGTSYGDVNLDGQFDSNDFVALFENGVDGNELPGLVGWSGGDWNCDGKFDSDDLIIAFQDQPYQY